jgi:predicted DNA-binding transcriptional regulator YafY
MRADRLVSILLLLQRRGQVTAHEVAAELEVSERTARRDLEALAMAGIPVYAERGRHGGWRLAGGGKTDLSGLTAAEAQALFLVAGPSSTATPEVRAALRKLVRALPEPMRDRAEAASTAVVVDPSGWDRSPGDRPAPAHLEAAQSAVVRGLQVRLGYVARGRDPTSRIVHPLGLAAKGAAWYLIAGTEAGLRTFRVDRITSLDLTGDPVVKPPGFDLGDAWRLIADEVERKRTPVRARASVVPEMVGTLRFVLGRRLGIGPTGADGRVQVELRGRSVRSLAGEIAGLGAAVEVLSPPELRRALAVLGRELTATYPDEDEERRSTVPPGGARRRRRRWPR